MPDDWEQLLRATQLLRDQAKAAPTPEPEPPARCAGPRPRDCFPSPHRAHESSAGAGLQRHFCCKSLHKIHGKHLKPDLAQSQLLTDAIVPPPRSLQGSEGTEKSRLPRGMRGEARGAVGGRAEGARPCLRWSERLLDLNNTEDETDCDKLGSEGSRGRLLWTTALQSSALKQNHRAPTLSTGFAPAPGRLSGREGEPTEGGCHGNRWTDLPAGLMQGSNKLTLQNTSNLNV